MRVFVTGATGFVGSAVVQELLAAGHQVLGLARNDEGARVLTAAGAEVHHGDLEDLESLRSGASTADGVIHCGFVHDFSRFKEVCEIDRKAIELFGSVLAGTDRPLIVTTGIGLLSAPGRLLTEQDVPQPGPNPRIASDEAAEAAANGGVRVSLVRLPPTVHGVGDHGFIPILINAAREKGVSVYKEAGQNRWPAVHRLDAAKVYRLALEQAPVGLTRYHAVAEEGIAFADIAKAIGQGLNVPTVSKTTEEAAEHFGWFAHFASFDCASSSEQTRKTLGWQPAQPGLLDDMNEGHYFTA